MTTRTSALALAAALVVAGCASTADTATEGAPADPPATASATEGSTSTDAPPMSAMCAEDATECDDTPEIVPGPSDGAGGAAGACLAGATECNDIPGGTPAGPPGEATPVEPRDGLVDLRPTPWESVQPVDEEQAVLAVTFFGADEACEGLDEVEVELSAEAVTLTVVTGRDPEVEVCTAEAVRKVAEVDLGEPLGPRSILDGAVDGSGDGSGDGDGPAIDGTELQTPPPID